MSSVKTRTRLQLEKIIHRHKLQSRLPDMNHGVFINPPGTESLAEQAKILMGTTRDITTTVYHWRYLNNRPVTLPSLVPGSDRMILNLGHPLPVCFYVDGKNPPSQDLMIASGEAVQLGLVSAFLNVRFPAPRNEREMSRYVVVFELKPL